MVHSVLKFFDCLYVQTLIWNLFVSLWVLEFIAAAVKVQKQARLREGGQIF